MHVEIVAVLSKDFVIKMCADESEGRCAAGIDNTRTANGIYFCYDGDSLQHSRDAHFC